MNDHHTIQQTATAFLGQLVTAHIDRPLGARHPTHGFIYLLNYGNVPGVLAPDGEERDVYVLGEFEPLVTFTGRCIAVIHRLDDDDDKLVLVQDGKNYSDEQISALTEFQERFFHAVILRAPLGEESFKMQPREQMKVDLLQAMKARQSATVATLRSVLAAIDNAEAVPVSEPAMPAEPAPGQRHEAPRKLLSADDIRQIIRKEVDERRAASRKYATLGLPAEAERLQTAATLIETYLNA